MEGGLKAWALAQWDGQPGSGYMHMIMGLVFRIG